MDKGREILLLTMLNFCYKNGYQFNVDINDKYFNDKEVIDCQLTLYLLLLTKEGEEQDRMFKEFEDKYNRLSKEKQEYIKRDLKKIFEKQDKNIKEKEKKI